MKKMIVLLAVALALLISGSSAAMTGVGAGPGDLVSIDWGVGAPPVRTQLETLVPGRVFNIDLSAGGVFLPPLYYDPIAGPIYKIIEFPVGITMPIIELWETTTVACGTPWTDWHEVILTPGWEWAWDIPPTAFPPSDPTGVFGMPGVLPDGVIDLSVVNFFFDQPVLPGDEIWILKSLIYTGVDFDPTIPVVIAEYPTVPIPVLCLDLNYQ